MSLNYLLKKKSQTIQNSNIRMLFFFLLLFSLLFLAELRDFLSLNPTLLASVDLTSWSQARPLPLQQFTSLVSWLGGKAGQKWKGLVCIVIF